MLAGTRSRKQRAHELHAGEVRLLRHLGVVAGLELEEAPGLVLAEHEDVVAAASPSTCARRPWPRPRRLVNASSSIASHLPQQLEVVEVARAA